MNAAAKRPAAIDKITTIDGFGRTISRLERADDDRYAAAKHPARRFGGEKRTSKGSCIGDDPQGPADRTIDSRQCFRDLHDGYWVGFITAELVRTDKAQQAGLAGRLDNRLGEPPELFRLADVFA